jgi:hypothetical protein
MKSIYKISLVSLVFFIYNSKDHKKEERSLNEPSMSYKKLKDLAIIKGDTNAYHEMSIAYMDSPNNTDFINTALIMANKHNFHEAYLDVYYCLTDYYHRKDFKNLDDLDKKQRDTALKYLIMGSEKKDKECRNLLGYYYLEGKYIEKDTIKGLKLIKESEN